MEVGLQWDEHLKVQVKDIDLMLERIRSYFVSKQKSNFIDDV